MNNSTVKKSQQNKFISILIELVLFLIIFSIGQFKVGYSDSQLDVMRVIGILALVTLFFLFIALFFFSKYINYFHIFLAFAFLFSFGQSILVIFTNKIDMTRLLSVGNGKLSALDIYSSALYVLKAIISLTIGYTLVFNANINVGTKGTTGKASSKKYVKKFNKIGWLFFIISIIPTFFMLYKDIVVLNSVGYIGTLQAYSGVEKVFSLFMGFFPSSFIIIFLSERKLGRRRVAYFILAIYLILQMLGGSRIVVFRFAILLLSLYLIKNKKIKIKKLILAIIITLILGFAFSVVSSLRNNIGKINSLSDFNQFIIGMFSEENLFYKVFFEAGNTQIINTVVYKYCPDTVGYCYGQSLLKMFLSIFPNIGLWEVYPTTITTDITFSPFFTELCGLGSSIFAESYWNFGEFGAIIFICLFGMLLAKLINKLQQSFKNGNIINKFLYSYILFYVVFLVRSDMIEFGRSFTYYCLFPIFVFYLVKPKYVKLTQKTLNIKKL